MYIKFLPNEYVIRYKKGKQTDAGRGLSFYCFDKSTTVAVVPVSVMDTDFIFEEKTEDFQNVTVQGQLAYRVTDYEKIAEMVWGLFLIYPAMLIVFIVVTIIVQFSIYKCFYIFW